jgi:hypothetical protein
MPRPGSCDEFEGDVEALALVGGFVRVGADYDGHVSTARLAKQAPVCGDVVAAQGGRFLAIEDARVQFDRDALFAADLEHAVFIFFEQLPFRPMPKL